MKRKGELFHVMNPRRIQIVWGVFYVVLAIFIFGGLYAVANHIKTHTLPTGKIELSTPFSKYVVGEPISFSLTNNYNTVIYITNQCPNEPLAVYRQDNGKWVRIHDVASAKDCPSEQRQVSIPASSTVTSSFAPWHHLFTQPGKYRLVAIVNEYNSLPYIDFEVITSPLSQLVQLNMNATTNKPTPFYNNLVQSRAAAQATTQTQIQISTPTPPPPAPSPPPPIKPPAKTYTLHVNSSGNYDLTSLTLNSGDFIKFVYSPPINSEVRTHFTPVPPTTTNIGSITLDGEFTTRTQVFNVTGTWTYKADDHNGNSGTLTVN